MGRGSVGLKLRACNQGNRADRGKQSSWTVLLCVEEGEEEEAILGHSFAIGSIAE